MEIMLRETQEARNDLSGDAAGTADGLKSSRRGFLSGTGLGAIGAAIGGGMPFSNELGSLIPAAKAEGGPPPPPAPAASKGPTYLKFPGKNEGLVVLGDRPLVA